MSKEKVKPSLFVALLPFIFLIIFMLLGTLVYSSPAQIPLILISQNFFKQLLYFFEQYKWFKIV